MQISTSVGVVQDILISRSFQNIGKLILGHSSRKISRPGYASTTLRRNWRVAHHGARNSRASEANVPERAVAHRQKLADRRPLDAPSEVGHQPPLQGGHQATGP